MVERFIRTTQISGIIDFVLQRSVDESTTWQVSLGYTVTEDYIIRTLKKVKKEESYESSILICFFTNVAVRNYLMTVRTIGVRNIRYIMYSH